MKIRGNEVFWLSDKENIAVVYSQFDLGAKYKVYHKAKYGDNHYWDYVTSFGFYGEALKYAKKIYDIEVEK